MYTCLYFIPSNKFQSFYPVFKCFLIIIFGYTQHKLVNRRTFCLSFAKMPPNKCFLIRAFDVCISILWSKLWRFLWSCTLISDRNEPHAGVSVTLVHNVNFIIVLMGNLFTFAVSLWEFNLKCNFMFEIARISEIRHVMLLAYTFFYVKYQFYLGTGFTLRHFHFKNHAELCCVVA